MASTSINLQNQWANPGDLLSLFLLIGSDVVQQAISQLVGHRIHLPGMGNRGFPVTPVALSFGWVAYAFFHLVGVVGDMKLMPTNKQPSILVTCANGFVRENRSWVLGRLLRDHEIRCDAEPVVDIEGDRHVSIRIDIFQLGPALGPDRDFVWWVGWVVILIQLGVAIIPWVLYDNWGIFLVTLSGNLLVAATCALSQWEEEKWPGPGLLCESVFCLTRGNGHRYIMVFIGAPGSWHMERLATGSPPSRKETRWVFIILAILWTCLLINLAGLKENTLYFMGIGILGLLHNVLAAKIPRKPGALNMHIRDYSRATTIFGRPESYTDESSVDVDLEKKTEDLSDVVKWISHKQNPTARDNAAATTVTGLAMPRWLSSMSEGDGVPDWLKPIKRRGLDSRKVNAAIEYKRQPDSGNDRNKSKHAIYATGVHGALMELEKWVPTAGLAMVQIFFPGGLKYNDEAIRDNVHKKF